ncbi:K-stimulated pyrophosphate-energized sodium pump protein isoform X2 [Carex rostrata]
MQEVPTNRRSDYLAALTQEIERKLQKALTNHSQRLQVLQQLFADIALEIDDRARDIILTKKVEGGGISKLEDIAEGGCICFYEVLADHYVKSPESARRILDLIMQLWSQSFVSHIFALLFHKWSFEVPIDESEASTRYGSALVQGASDVFWIDIQTNTRHFFSLFRYLLEEVALIPDRSKKISIQCFTFCTLGEEDILQNFLMQFPTYPNSFLVGGPADYFVIELTDMLQKLKVEPVLIHYLSRMGVLQGLELRMATSTRLKACLYSFTSPGGPAYPTRAVRHAAWNTLDFLFPVGRYPRHVISLFFRLLYPWYWPSSCWNFIMTCVKTIFYYVLGLIISSWESMNRPKNA